MALPASDTSHNCTTVFVVITFTRESFARLIDPAIVILENYFEGSFFKWNELIFFTVEISIAFVFKLNRILFLTESITGNLFRARFVNKKHSKVVRRISLKRNKLPRSLASSIKQISLYWIKSPNKIRWKRTKGGWNRPRFNFEFLIHPSIPYNFIYNSVLAFPESLISSFTPFPRWFMRSSLNNISISMIFCY